jgi:hypothetical protein
MSILVVYPILVRDLRDVKDRPAAVQDCHELSLGTTQNSCSRGVTL